MVRTSLWKATTIAWSFAVALLPAVGNAVYLNPSPYLSFSDSPFKGGAFSYFHLEDFEDGALNTPGVWAPVGFALRAGPLTDSVDADDGAVDGSGNGGGSFYSAGNHTLSFVFDGGVLGGLPTHVGLVWTDVGFSSDTINTCAAGQQDCGFGNVSLEAFDPENASLGVIGPFWLGDGDVGGQTAEERYFGVTNASGISRITLTMPGSGDWEIDHLQYGLAVPEPPSIALLAFALLTMVIGRRAMRRVRLTYGLAATPTAALEPRQPIVLRFQRRACCPEPYIVAG